MLLKVSCGFSCSVVGLDSGEEPDIDELFEGCFVFCF